jgi:hypothetical protein
MQNSNIKTESVKAKFEPGDGECLFFIGQDMRAIGGLENYSDGYCDHFEVPAGITLYTGFAKGTASYGYIQKGNDGIKTIANWGAEDSSVQCYIDDADFKHSMISVGLSLVGNEKKVAKGQHDDLIRELGEWIKEIERPVFLRIGYEFDGWDWNHYNKKQYLASWRRIHSMFSEMDVNNVALVWQSKGKGSNQAILEEWYPGDAVVDWCGYSYFDNPDEEMLTFARKHKKPVFIAEATPILIEGKQFSDTFLTNPEHAKQAWEDWFVPFIKTLNENKNVIKAFSYINVNWSIQPMWTDNNIFKHVDSRIQQSEFITKKWLEEIANPRYLKPNSKLWSILENKD